MCKNIFRNTEGTSSLDYQLNFSTIGSDSARPFPSGTDQPPKPHVFEDYRQLSS